jgi:hypothetical protein
MPVIVRKRRGKYRVVEKDNGRIAKTDKGNSRDGGGHIDKAKAQRQARAINSSLRRRRLRRRSR